MFKRDRVEPEPTITCVRSRDAIATGERLLFAGGNPTFHRSISEDYVIRLTDRALYLPVSRGAPFRPRKCRRIPTELIADSAVRPWRLPTLVFAGGVTIVVTCLGLILSEMLPGLPQIAFGSLIENSAPAVVVAVFAVMVMAGSHNRTEFIVILRSGRTLRFITPADTHHEEKRYDRQVLDRALQACKAAGFA